MAITHTQEMLEEATGPFSEESIAFHEMPRWGGV
jgi:hypothetical protein